VRGHFTITDNASGAVTLSDDARFDVGQLGVSAGTFTITITVNDAVPLPVAGVVVDIYNSTNTVHLFRVTDTDLDGVVAVNLDAGTYKVRLSGLGFTPDAIPETLVVTASANVTYTGTAFATPAAASPVLCTVYGYALDAIGVARNDITIEFLGDGPIGISGNQVTIHKISVVTGPNGDASWAAGYFELDLIRLATVRVRSLKLDLNNLVITVPNSASSTLTALTEAAK